ncbi:MAG: hypothetical protein H3C62_14040 [Gemmatimonadaceae bacterium]|nr:hypothetical protein [Gemmatimonadaceae bacterium]
MSLVVAALMHGAARAEAEWPGLVQAFRTALVQARECEFRAANASELALTTVSPSYPPLVRDLAHAGGYVEGVAS